MKKIMYYTFDILINNIVKLLGISLLFVVGAQIFSRMFMKIPFSWSEELARFVFIWYCFLGSAVTLKDKQHLGIDYFYRKFNRSKHIIDIIIQFLTGVFGAYITYYGLKILEITGRRFSPVMRINMAYIFMCIPITGILFVLVAIENIIDISNSNKHLEDPQV